MKKIEKSAQPTAQTPEKKNGRIKRILRNVGIVFVALIVIALLLPDSESNQGQSGDRNSNAIQGNGGTSQGQEPTQGSTPPEMMGQDVTDLSNYLGKTLSDVADLLQIEFVKIEDKAKPQYSSYNIVYQGNTALFGCYTDSNQVIAYIRLLDSGKRGYNIYGITSKMDQSEAYKLLFAIGATQITESIWQCGDGTDALTCGKFSWELEHNSQMLQNVILQKEAEEEFSYQFEDSIGAYYIGNGQIVEYISTSFAAVSYEFKQSTGYQAEKLNKKYDGRYMLASGTISNISSDGIIEVHCIDESAAQEGVLHIPSGDAFITLINEQEILLEKLDIGTSVDILARFEGGSRSGFFFADNYDLYDGIIIAINDIMVDIPYIEKKITGITTYNQRNVASSSMTREMIETDYYTLTLPASWNGRYAYENWNSEWGNYLSIYELGDYNDGLGAGTLFSILLQEDEELLDGPDYYSLGTLVELPEDGVRPMFLFYVAVYIPTDGQFSEERAATYIEMSGDIDAILASFTAREGYALISD